MPALVLTASGSGQRIRDGDQGDQGHGAADLDITVSSRIRGVPRPGNEEGREPSLSINLPEGAGR